VVQALIDLSPGQPITQDMVTLVPTEDRPSAGTLSMLSQAVGKVVRSPIIKGEPLDSGKLLDSGNYLSVEPGKRAITIQVDTIGGLNGALIPGSHVDILTTVKDKETQNPLTRTVLQNIPVLSVGDSPDGKSAKQQTGGIPVTLAVAPPQAELLALANLAGTFHLTLRNYNDSRVPKVGGADMNTLMTAVSRDGLGKSVPPPPHMPASGGNDGFHNVNFSPDAGDLPSPDAGGPSGSKFSMQIYRGTGSETVDFQQ
jgi:pilus assembly protein CpaB